jgi:hypothetical protein
MIEFFKKYADLSSNATKPIYAAWAQVVSNLNEAGDMTPQRIIYMKNDQTCEISSDTDPNLMGIFNMLNVIAKLIPDEILQEAWDANPDKRNEQAAQKLTRLFELFSREKFELTWENRSNNEQSIQGPFPGILFEVNKKPALVWKMTAGHFQLDSIKNNANDWRTFYNTPHQDFYVV